MSRNQSNAHALLRQLLVLLLGALVLLTATGVAAQCRSQDDGEDASPHSFGSFPDPKKPPALEEPILPEAGFLSDTHYTSQFFGFSLDLPLTVKGHEIMVPVMPEREHALLWLQFEKGQQRGYFSIAALDPKPGLDVKTPEKQIEQQIRIWAQNPGPTGLTPEFPIPDYMMHTGHWYYSQRHKHDLTAVQYWTAINNYVVKIVIETNDREFLNRAKTAVAESQFYCPQEDGTLMTTKGKPAKIEGEPYQGPTVPTFRVNQAIKNQPAKDIAAGKVTNTAYHNPELGLNYEFPKDWQALPPDHSNPPGDDVSREYQFLHSCSQTLLRIVPRPPRGSNTLDGTTITLRALDYNCLSLRIPFTLKDKRTLDEVAATLEETGEFGRIDTDQLKMISDRLFMVYNGTYTNDARTEDLAQRMSQTMYATKYNKMLLVWTLMAPTQSELEQLPTGRIVLEGEPAIQLHEALSAKN
jgi:hypothetical protein